MEMTLANKNLNRLLRLVLLHGFIYLTACSTIEPNTIDQPSFSIRQDEIFGERPDITGIQEIHQLTLQQKKDFLDYFHSRAEKYYPSYERVVHYLKEVLSDFEYHNNTYTATETLDLLQGNCLSLAILTTAIAKIADVDIDYQLADSTPVFEFNENIVIKGLHIRTKLIETGWSRNENTVVLSRPGVRIDYFPSGTERFINNISEQEYLARYYLNLAATAMTEKDYTRAYWLTLESMEHYPLSSDAFNNMAIIYRHMGKPAKSEEIYLYSIEHFPNNVTLLKNYRILLTLQKRLKEAEELTRRIADLDDPSPFNMFHAARDSYNGGDYYEAIDLYKKAIRGAPYLHEAHLGLALSYYQLGRFSAAEKQLREALDHTYTSKTRSLYQAKLTALTGELHPRGVP